MKTFHVEDPQGFKETNLSNWQDNITFWLGAKLRHVPHVLPLAARILSREATRAGQAFTVIDIGCGNAWVYRLMKELGIESRYVGLDFNESLIEHLQSQMADSTASFRHIDIELGIPSELTQAADVVVNAFNFFELASMQAGFAHAIRMVKAPRGGLLVFHVDPLSQLISLAATLDELRAGLFRFEEHGSRLAYDKPIDLQEGETGRVYKGILYSFSEYHRLARLHGFQLEGFPRTSSCKGREPAVVSSGILASGTRRCLVSRGCKMGLRDVERGAAISYLTREAISFAPAIVALFLIYDEGKSSWASIVFQRLNRIGGNAYPLGSAVLLLVVAGFLSTALNLVFYCVDVWRELTRDKAHAGKRWQLAALIALVLNGAILVGFVVILFLTFLGWIQHERWMAYLLLIGRWCAVVVFVLFLLGDLALCNAQAARTQEVNGDDLLLHQNDMSLSRLSVGVIDLPALALAVLVLGLVWSLNSNPAFHLYRDMGWPMHTVLRSVQSDTFDLALYGLEAGILAATLISSQLVFAVLMFRWHLKAAEIRRPDTKKRSQANLHGSIGKQNLVDLY